MILVMTLLVRDEQDILPANIEYHLSQGVDFIIATDHSSRDATPDILKYYERRGVLHYILEQEEDAQQPWVTRMARMAFEEYEADWVINSYADEFWWFEGGALRHFFAQQALDTQAVAAASLNFIARPEMDKYWFADSMTVRDTASLNAQGQPLSRHACHRGHADINIGVDDISAKGETWFAQPTEQLLVFNFPMRCRAQKKADMQPPILSISALQTGLAEQHYVEDLRLQKTLHQLDAAHIVSLSYLPSSFQKTYHYARYKLFGF